MSARGAAREAADNAMAGSAGQMISVINQLYSPIDTLVGLLTYHQVINAKTLEQRLTSLQFFQEAMTQNAQVSAVYVGYQNGDFFLIRHLRRTEARNAAKAPENAAYLVQSIEHDNNGKLQGRYIYYDAALKLIRSDLRPDYTFDPRSRPWFQQAVQSPSGVAIHTAPYLFFTTREIGQTFARCSSNGQSIVAADLTLQDLSENLARQKVTPSTELALFDLQGHPLGYKDPSRLIGPNGSDGKPTLNHIGKLGVPIINRAFNDLALKGQIGKSITINESGREWYVRVHPLQNQNTSDNQNKSKAFLVIAAPTEEVFASALHTRNEMLLVTLVILLLALPITWWLANHVTKQLKDLSRQADDIKNFRFHTPNTGTSAIREIEQLSSTISQMKSTICKFLDIAAALSAERRLDQLLDHILTESISAGAAAGGAIYLLDQKGNKLFPSAMRSCEGPQSVENQTPINIEDASVVEAQLAQAVLTLEKQTLTMDVQMIQNSCFESMNPTGMSAKLSILPLYSRDQKALGVLILFYPKHLPAPTPERIAFVEALSGTAAISFGNQLFERMAAIDDLTGAYNRRYAEKRFEEEMLRTLRTGRSLGCLMIDIDKFKQINDRLGHLTGDDILKKVTAQFAKCLRPYDILFRYGGDEFMAVLPEIELQEALSIGERIRQVVIEQSAAEIPITVSIGITINIGSDSHPEDMITRADKALYQAKNNGRNRVEVL
jgi:diguanylate cyclase (GGDEF)-like protein